ncbi:hypothetical protein CTT31_11485 [Pseudoalteromonas maricaloris]|uniref:hypothetical protein n=1 Tax=Pseudoalteromonas maricaloris TaxID=184924 RepID=UPI0021AD5A07|nr:hypothetical protein [Pseudoalteromonas flavipulchra]USE69710.1 hypothetical protein CTT31_11485 [Pseudoalteromonas flavipulchra]
MRYVSENIGEISRLLREHKVERKSAYISNFDATVKDKAIAELLINAQLATPELTKKNVVKLLSGQLSWPKCNDETYQKVINVDLSTLEKLGLVTFYGNYCQINAYSIPDKDELHESCHSLHEAFELLKNIVSGREGFVKPYFKIDKEVAKSVLKAKSLPFIISEFTDERGFYHLQALKFELDSLIAEFLWNAAVDKLGFKESKTDPYKLDFEHDEIEPLEKWFLISNVYSSGHFVNINFQFVNDFNQQVYTAFLGHMISKDEQLKQPQYVLVNKWACELDVRGLFLNIQGTSYIQINISDASRDQSSYKEVIKKRSIEEIESLFFTVSGLTASTGCSIFFEPLLRQSSFRGRPNYYFSALKIIIEADIYTDTITIDSRGQLEQLFEASKSSYELRDMLMKDMVDFCSVEYLLYLLSQKETATSALYIFSKYPRLQALDLSHDERARYHLKYFPVVCNEFLNMHHKTYFNINSEHESIGKGYVVELLTLMAKRFINLNYRGEPNAGKDCLDILLNKMTLEQVSLISEPLIDDIEEDGESDLYKQAWKYYLLFWLLEKAENYNFPNRKQIVTRSQKLILALYCKQFNSSVDNKDHSFNAYMFFDLLPWWRIQDCYVAEYLDLVGQPHRWFTKLVVTNDFCWQNKSLLRGYYQLLMALYSENREQALNNSIISKILALLETFGFADEPREIYSIFDDDWNDDYRLWRKFSTFVENLNDYEFSRVIETLRAGAPPLKTLELCHQLNRKSRKTTLLEFIKDLSTKEAFGNQGINDLEASLDYACRVGLVDTAEHILKQGLLLLNDKKSYINQRLPEMEILHVRNKWEVYKYKISLLLIYNDEQLCDKAKLKKVQELSTPFDGEVISHNKQDLITDCDCFRRNICALIFFNEEPETAYNYFDGLYKQLRHLSYAGNRFSSKLNYLERRDASISEYRAALDEWLDSIQGADIQKIESVIISRWFNCLCKVADYKEADSVWAKLSTNQCKNIAIVTSYCNLLKERGEHYSAQTIFEDLRRYHKVSSLGEDADEQLRELEQLIIGDMEPKQILALTKNTTYSIVNRPKSVDELRRALHEIQSKDLPDLASIIGEPNSTPELFLYNQISKIIGELLVRKNNLNVKLGEKSNKSHRIVKEDLINDWVTSLFDHRMSYLGLSCRDQKRGGRSSRQNSDGVGEIDFFLCDKNNERIAIMEAFRLFSHNTTVIDEHLNKIAGYDQECLSPVFILAYCDVAGFSELCDKYYERNKNRDYLGFNKSRLQNEQIENTKSDSSVSFYKEIRYRDKKPVVIYHMMVNLRFDS